MTTKRDPTIQELHALPDNVLLTAPFAAKMLNLPLSTFERLVKSGMLDEARFEPTPRAVRYWKRKLLDAATEAGRRGKAGAAKPAGG